MNNAQAAAGQAGFTEFVVLIALIISLVALSIDAMLPALPEIARELGLVRMNDSQFVISVFFAGMALGQMLFGPLSDSVGRKPSIMSGFVVFAAGSVLCMLANDFELMLLGRFLQGLGASGPRIVSIALVRDRYRGPEMARVMSFVMSIFILVPVFAPAVGQVIVNLANWRYIFTLFLALTLISSLWFWIRQAETLAIEKRVRFSFVNLIRDIRAIAAIRATFGYTLAMGFIFGAFLGYLSSSQQIFQIQYQLHSLFPLYFGILACSIGMASLLNARLVMRFGMRRLSNIALIAITGLSFPFLLLALGFDGQPPLAVLMAYLMTLFFCLGILFGNLNAMAMEPLGHLAGLGSALIGSLSTLMSVFLGVLVSDAYNDTVIPLVLGFALLGLAALLMMLWTGKAMPGER